MLYRVECQAPAEFSTCRNLTGMVGIGQGHVVPAQALIAIPA